MSLVNMLKNACVEFGITVVVSALLGLASVVLFGGVRISRTDPCCRFVAGAICVGCAFLAVGLL